MKKINIEKQEKMLKAMAPNLFETIVVLVSLILTAIAIDLKLEAMSRVCSSIFLSFFFYVLIWMCHSLFIAFVKKRREKQNKSADVPTTVEAQKLDEAQFLQEAANVEEALIPGEVSLEEVNKENENQ